VSASPAPAPLDARAIAQRRVHALLVRLIAGLGVAADAALFVLKAPGPLRAATYLFALWLMLPWLAVLVLAWWRYVPGLLAGVLAAASFQALAFYAAFLAPPGTTMPVVYATKPSAQFAIVIVCVLGARWRERARRVR
jgi:hypothetical protein